MPKENTPAEWDDAPISVARAVRRPGDPPMPVRSPHERYRIFGFGLESAIALPELPPANLTPIALRFTLADPSPTPEPNWFHCWHTPHGTQTLACARERDGYRLRFPNLADFVVEGPCEGIRGLSPPGTPPAILRHLLLDQVVPRALAQRGHLILHASAVRLPEGCACIVAASGAGKSTLAAALQRAGGTLLADDAVLLRPGRDGIECIPSYASLRLWPESLAALGHSAGLPQTVRADASKHRLFPAHSSGGGEADVAALTALFVLAPPQAPPAAEIAVQPMRGAQGLAELLEHAFVLDVYDQRFAARQLVSLAAVVNAGLRIYRLRYPRDFALLPTVGETIASILAAPL